MRWRPSSPALLVSAVVVLAGCGDLSVHTVDAAAVEAGFCGTHANPGILELENLAPPRGATVNNDNIVHGFIVRNAPAEFRNFELRFTATHTAGRPSPENPKFALVTVGSDVAYQLTIVSWSRSPGHVEMVASAGYDTSAGCAWSFPSPLFSYDITGGPDGGGGPPEPAGKADAAAPRIDAAIDSAPPPADAPAESAAAPVDAAVDGGAADAPENFDVTAEASPSLDAPLAPKASTDR